jgi:hypothetical protein
MDMSTANVTQTPKARKPRPPKAPKEPKEPKDPNAPPPQPKAPKAPKERKPRPPKAPADPNAPPKEPKVRKPRPPKAPKVDITHAGPIHYHETDEPTQPSFVAVYSETLEQDVPTKQRKQRSSGLDLSMANLRL